MKKKKRNGIMNHDIERLTPLITVNEPDECIFAIVDFSLPGGNHVRRIISKKNLKDGKISAVIYDGEVGADNLCSNKTNIMTMRDATPEKFWKAVNTMGELYRVVGGTSDIRLYEGKTMREAAQLMKRFGHAQVWGL
jgi:hypothetical protein